jgi:ATP-dependent Clp protease ATP-binding subunit ClpC
MMLGVRERFEEHHSVKIPTATIETAANLAEKYINEGFLPDKAIDLLDLACTNRAFNSVGAHKTLAEIKRYETELEKAITNKQFDKAEKINLELNKLRSREGNEEGMGKVDKVLPSDIITVVATKLNIEPKDISLENDGDAKALLGLENELKKKIIGQDDAINKIASAVRRGRAGLKNPNRPVGSFLFVGASGVGKTALAKELAALLYPRKEGILRVDMSELMEQSSVSKLLGSAPGYVGYNDANRLTEHIRKNPHCVDVFDEIEKAHRDVLNILLQILEEGVVTDGSGRQIKFNNTIIVMTSNIGGDLVNTQSKSLGFAEGAEGELPSISGDVMKRVKKELPPEFLGRIDDIIVFNQLEYPELIKIAGIMLDELSVRINANSGVKITFPHNVAEHMAEMAAKQHIGARPLRRIIQTEIEDVLADKILSGSFNQKSVEEFAEAKA